MEQNNLRKLSIINLKRHELLYQIYLIPKNNNRAMIDFQNISKHLKF